MKLYKIFSLVCFISFCSCSDWLDVEPKDKVLQSAQYGSEVNINSVLNGLYRQLSDKDLYGKQLTQTTIETMGHQYWYPLTRPQDNQATATLYRVSYFIYDEVKSKYLNIWTQGYITIFRINDFIANVEASQGVLSEDKKNILLGEAYALRAYIHFDLFRLFGPIYKLSLNDESIPYNNSAEAVPHQNEKATDFLNLVLKDIAKAEQLLAKDPIITDEDAVTETLGEGFYKNRNRRLNYYGVLALKARVAMYKGDVSLAKETAQTVLTKSMGDKRPFNWAPTGQDVIDKTNYMAFTEIIFGINNQDLHSNWISLYNHTVVADETFIASDENLRKNIFIYNSESDKTYVNMQDSRAKQWKETNLSDVSLSAIGGGYTISSSGVRLASHLVSHKFVEPSATQEKPYVKYLQPLIRIAEMQYILAEIAIQEGDLETAKSIFNLVLEKKGLSAGDLLGGTAENPIPVTKELLEQHLEKEYYREFYGEGQVFFFHKRRNDTKIFKGNEGGYFYFADTKAVYVIPIPEEETNI